MSIRPFLRAMLCLALTLSAMLAHSQDLRPYVVGDWQCQSKVNTEYGNGLLIGATRLQNDGQLNGDGNLLLSYPGFEAEIPFASTVKARWVLEGKRISVSQLTGTIQSPYPLLTVIAESFQQQALAQQEGSATLVRLSKNIMQLKADDGSDIQCVRAKS